MVRTISNEDYMKAIQMDFEVSKMWALKWQTLILSGAYKQRKMYRLAEPDNPGEPSKKIPYTEDELLKDAMDTMARHIHRMNDLADRFKSLANGNDPDAE